MAVFRIHKTKDFAILSLHHLKNSQLSLKSKGLLSLMLSLPDDWDYSVMGLASLSKDGKDSVMSALNELSDAGYVNIENIRNARGQYESIYNVYETPNRESRCGESESVNPTQYSIKINDVNREPLNNPTLFPNENKDSVISPSRGKEYDLSFVSDEFKPIFTKWLDYKRAKKQTYKTPQSLKTCYNRLIDYSDNDVDVAEEIINEAIAYNYAGFFRPKNKNKKDSRPFEVRRDEFYEKVNAFYRTPEYANEKELLAGFYNYWVQKTDDGRMLWETQPAFDIERRLRIEKSKRKKNNAYGS